MAWIRERRSVGKSFAALVRGLAVAALLSATAAIAADVPLAWDPVSSPSLAGYTVHWGTASGSYTSQVDVASATHTVSGLVEGTTYYFSVTARDGAGGRSAYSNEVVATPPYTVPVADFSASAVSGNAPLAVNFTNSSTGTITTYAWTFGDGTTSSAQNPVKTYSVAGTYTVALTVTGPGGSNTRTRASYITVSASADTTPPSAPGSATATANGSTAINLSWAAATDNVGVTGYRVERCSGSTCTTFTQVATPAGTSFADSGLTASTTYRYRVRATDAAGNLGAYSPIASATTGAAPDTTAPSAPGSATATASGSTAIDLSWAAATDNVGVTGYRVERCTGASCTGFTQVATPAGTSFADSGLTASTTYRYRVRATDAAGNLGAYSPIASATTAVAADTTAPSAPGTPTVTANGSTAINVSWPAATDNVGVTGYRVERCTGGSCTNFAQVATPAGTSFADSGLTASTTYRYRVRATDAAGNLGPYSATRSATTAAATDTTAPSAPASATATANGSTAINLSWPAATDNVGVTGYRVERCSGSTCTTFTQIATPAGTSLADSGLTASTTYRYRVRATDAAGNLGAYSPIASSTTTAAAPVASFSATPVTGTAPLSVTFTSTSTGSITTYAWNFGDGTTSAVQNPSKVYSNAGSYTVSLTVTGPGGSHTATQTDYISVSAGAATLSNVGILVDRSGASGTASNVNGILEPGETVLIAPMWELTAGASVSVSASAQVSGQGSSAFGLGDRAASYGSLSVGQVVDCASATGNCYLLSVSTGVRRPTRKWGITFTETLSTGTVSTRTIPIGKTFADVAPNDIFYAQIEAMAWNDVTYGYDDGTYQPSLGVTRWQTAMFLARASAKAQGVPAFPVSGTVGTTPFSCTPGGSTVFTDVSPTDPGCKAFHYLANRRTNLSFECGSSTLACPDRPTTRAAMAVEVAGSIVAGGDAGVPATGTFNDTGTARSYNCAVTEGSHFTDVPSSASYCRHVNYLWARGIVDGYGGGIYHPELSLTRGQMAKFVANAFKLTMD